MNEWKKPGAAVEAGDLWETGSFRGRWASREEGAGRVWEAHADG